MDSKMDSKTVQSSIVEEVSAKVAQTAHDLEQAANQPVVIEIHLDSMGAAAVGCAVGFIVGASLALFR